MDRLNFYSGQLVNHNDLNTLENNIENKDKELTQKLIGYGIVEGFNVVSNSPADLTVLVNPGYAVDQYGQTIKLLIQKQVNLAPYVPSSNKRYVTLYAKFARKEYETRTNDIGEELKYRQDEDCEIVIAVGEVGATPVKPNIPSEGVLLADVLLSSGQTQITTIDNTRRQSLINMLIHQIDKNNPHQVKLSQLADYTLSGDLNANGKKICNLAFPQADFDAVYRKYIDDMLVGAIQAFAMSTPPSGWLECNGQAISRTEYSRLFSKIGTIYGAGDGVSTFNIPDLRGQFLRGWDNNRNIDIGRTFGSNQQDAFQGHYHTLTGNNPAGAIKDASTDTFAGYKACSYSPVASVTNPISDGVNGTPRIASETRPTNVAILFCIKY